ncbi:hypothetical protein PISL3812_02526 [Talaromyces islandicus]|uniref:Survival Motor Neuron Gemin2-binding domain-containing protein n=1 Tax=Talaromyces islandicus TaxID=28573 RepID=A0A0U1LQ49_TALIS|nr:hypothetical protein PISL3812_02526 [Talaromyces islandicus]
MGKKKRSGALSHEEIWDDSALVRSWDDAVEEYKVYHSIHARGEDVEQVLNRAEEDGLDEPMDTEIATKTTSDVKVPLSVGQETQQPEISYSQPPTGAPAMPSALLGQVQDPALKNLMMSWYFAGYYTGLYEGQQQEQRRQQQQQQQQASQNTTTP